MIKVGQRKCRTQYFTEFKQEINSPQDRLAKGEKAKQRLHQLSIIDNQSQIFDPISNWTKYNQASLKLVNQQKKTNNASFDDTLFKLRKNTTIFPKKQVHQRNKKYVRDPQFMKKIKNSRRQIIQKNNYSSVLLKLNFTNSKNQDRIHSHSVKLDPSGILKIEPKNHFANFQKIVPKTQVKNKSILIKSRAGRSRMSNQTEKKVTNQKKQSNKVVENYSEGIFPPSFANFHKFQKILQSLRKHQRQNILTIQTVYQKPASLKGTLRRAARFSTS